MKNNKIFFINGLNAKAGGGKSILNNYLKILEVHDTSNFYYVLCPNLYDYQKFNNNHIKVITLSKFEKSTFMLPFVYDFIIPKLIKKLRIDRILNFADIPIKTNIYQIFLFDWAYAVYLNDIFWKKMSFIEKIKRKVKIFYFKKNLNYVNQLTAQTGVIKKRLEDIYKINNIKIIPNAVSIDNLQSQKSNKNFNLGSKLKLLYLTKYYSHKNIEILIPLAKKIKDSNLNYKIILTIDGKEDSAAQKILDEIEKYNLENFVKNIGYVKMENVPALYQECNALLMPTILESFSGTYVEAMYHKIPIITSNKDFAKEICGEGAEYFEPLNVDSILESIQSVFENSHKKEFLVKYASKRLEEFLTWKQVFDKYENLMNDNGANE